MKIEKTFLIMPIYCLIIQPRENHNDLCKKILTFLVSMSIFLYFFAVFLELKRRISRSFPEDADKIAVGVKAQ